MGLGNSLQTNGGIQLKFNRQARHRFLMSPTQPAKSYEVDLPVLTRGCRSPTQQRLSKIELEDPDGAGAQLYTSSSVQAHV
eukprot:1158720-Pelagomonas_calceolata.AAC.3